MRRERQRGAALLLAMLTVAVVATLAAGATWHQWRALEVEMAERQRSQSAWILTGALDWARLILREDARGNRRSGNADHLGEPWAMPLEESRLSSFLAADANHAGDDAMDAFLSGHMVDLQGRLNLRNLLRSPEPGATTHPTLSEPDLADFRRLYARLGLDVEELETLAHRLLLAAGQGDEGDGADGTATQAAPLMPAHYAQLAWLGLSPASLRTLAPHATWLPERTRVNLNTASEEVLMATLPGLEPALARQLVTQRTLQPFTSLEPVRHMLPRELATMVDAHRHDVRSQHFLVQGRLRLGEAVIEERSVVTRAGLQVTTRWRQRHASRDAPPR
jgi:general secretion pathway protein K